MEHERYVTIQELLKKGNDYTEDVETSAGTFQIRPLSWGEKAEIQADSLVGVKAKTGASLAAGAEAPTEADVDIDLPAMQKNQWEAKFKVLAYGLSVDKQRYTPETIKRVSLTTEVLNTLHLRILAISEVTPDELVPFRQDEDRNDDNESDIDGSSAIQK